MSCNVLLLYLRGGFHQGMITARSSKGLLSRYHAVRSIPPSCTNALHTRRTPGDGSNKPPTLTLSYTEGSTTPALLHHTLPQYYKDVILRSYADSSALISRHESATSQPGPPQRYSSAAIHWTFGEFDARITAVARGLLKLGIKKGDRVAVIMGNNRSVAVRTTVHQLVTHSVNTQARTPFCNGHALESGLSWPQ